METTVTMKLRKAVKTDIIDLYNNWRIGIMYFLKSEITEKFDPHPYYITADIDKKEFREYYIKGMIYVPKKIFEITVNE